MDRKTESFYAIVIILIGGVIVLLSAIGLIKVVTGSNNTVQGYDNSAPAFLVGTPSVQIVDNDLLEEYQINDADYEDIYKTTKKIINANDLNNSIINLEAVNSSFFNPFVDPGSNTNRLAKKTSQYQNYIKNATSSNRNSIDIKITQDSPNNIKASFDATYELEKSSSIVIIGFNLFFSRDTENSAWYLNDVQTTYSDQ